MRLRSSFSILAVLAMLALGFSAPSTDVAADNAAPGGALVTNPIGSPGWLPVSANERAVGFSVYRMIVTYDHSLDENGEEIDLITQGAWGMKIFSDAVVDDNGQDPPALHMVGHSPLISSLDDQGAPGEFDSAFMGVAGDVTDGDCANLASGGPSALSYAYSFTFTVTGNATAEDCQVVDSQFTDPQTGEVVTTTLTEYVPGFWVDVSWPVADDKIGGTGGPGRTFRQAWYGALPGFSSSSPDPAAASDTGNSTTLYGPMDEFLRAIVEDQTPGPGAGPVQGCPNSSGTGAVVTVTVPALPTNASKVLIDLVADGDWDLLVKHNGGDTITSGQFTANERVTIANVAEGDQLQIEGCNFAGGPEAVISVGWSDALNMY